MATLCSDRQRTTSPAPPAVLPAFSVQLGPAVAAALPLATFMVLVSGYKRIGEKKEEGHRGVR
jgi:hypothetical protein